MANPKPPVKHIPTNPDTRAAVVGVELSGEGPQPRCGRRRVALGQAMEFLAHASLRDHSHCPGVTALGASGAEHGWHGHRHAEIDETVGELGDRWG